MAALVRLQERERRQGSPAAITTGNDSGGFAELSPEVLAAMSQAGTEGRAMPSIECD